MGGSELVLRSPFFFGCVRPGRICPAADGGDKCGLTFALFSCNIDMRTESGFLL